MKNKDLKKRILDISYKKNLSHLGSCLTAVDIIDEIYKIKKPDEKFVLSAGHAHLAHLVVMEEYTNFEGIAYLEDLLKDYGIHCDRRAGCDASTGSLGHGIGIAVGMALADRTKNVYCLLSDGEMAEGSVFEALCIARTQKLDNLHIYVNANGYAAYRPVNADKLDNILGLTKRGVKVIKTDMNDYPEWIQGQIAHYKVLNEKEYKKLIKILL